MNEDVRLTNLRDKREKLMNKKAAHEQNAKDVAAKIAVVDQDIATLEAEQTAAAEKNAPTPSEGGE
jgi:hypothetical protein